MAATLCLVAFLCACSEQLPELPVVAQVPDFSLRDQADTEVTLATLRGHVWIANFIFTSCPDICPLLTKKMGDLRLGLVRKNAGVRFVSFSIDPETDTPAVLANYAKKQHADFKDWSFLTGPGSTIQDVVVQGFKQTVRPDPDMPDNILHGSHFVLVDRQGQIRGFYRSNADGLLALSKAASQLSTKASP